jgi:hypothetical protein
VQSTQYQGQTDITMIVSLLGKLPMAAQLFVAIIHLLQLSKFYAGMNNTIMDDHNSAIHSVTTSPVNGPSA